ncbi:MAG: DNA adenine methylase [Cyanobacteria bacterium J06638_20]
MYSLAPSQVSADVTPRPFLKWAGGKGKLIPQYRQFLPAATTFHTYYEPFLGGGAIFFHLLPHRACLMDINPELVNVYRQVRDNVEGVIELLQHHKLHHEKDYYYQVRSRLDGTPAERAARLIYLNRTCFNGLYRENSRGHFNVPMGRYKNPQICHTDLLRAVSSALKNTDIEKRSFETLLDQITKPNDFVYFDPPYYPLSATSKFTSYNRDAFTEADHIRLRDVFATLARRGVPVMLSNSDCPFVRELYNGFNIHTISAIRAINANTQRRGKITEVLVTSY